MPQDIMEMVSTMLGIVMGMIEFNMNKAHCIFNRTANATAERELIKGGCSGGM
jgi:hypothetical protein